MLANEGPREAASRNILVANPGFKTGITNYDTNFTGKRRMRNIYAASLRLLIYGLGDYANTSARFVIATKPILAKTNSAAKNAETRCVLVPPRFNAMVPIVM